MEDSIRISANHLAVILDLYDTIGHADTVYKPCQASAFRRVVTDKRSEALKAFAAITSPPEKGTKSDVELTAKDARLLTAFNVAMNTADGAYPTDSAGNASYRAYLHGVYNAPLNVQLMARVRQLLITPQPENTEENND